MSRLNPIASLGLIVLLAVGAGGAADLSPTQGTAGSDFGDPSHGRQLIQDVGCGSCHMIPGVPGANGLVGPPLERIGSRQYIAGMLHNTPDSMVTWIRFPQKIVPGNVMPDMGINESDARDIAAYLYTLK